MCGGPELLVADALAETAAVEAFAGATMADAGFGAAAGLAGDAVAGTVGAGLAGDALTGVGLAAAEPAAAGLSSYFSVAPEIGGTLQSLAFPEAAAPFASYAPVEGMSSSLPGWVPADVAIPTAVAEGSAVPGSFWENVSTPFKTAANVLEQGMNSPIAKTLGNVKKVSDIYGALTQDPKAPVVRVGGLQQFSQSQPGFTPSQAFGKNNFNSVRG